MPRDYASTSALVSQKLQDTGLSEFVAAAINYQIEESLKELAAYQPHIVPVLFKIESRSGQATSTSANNLVDATKSQFLAADATDEKVVHNTTKRTWAVVLTQASSSQIGLSSDIMAVNDSYAIYNKRCSNKRQIYIGDMPKYIGIDAVEYPLGTRRNWKLLHNETILEIDADTIDDSNANVTDKPNVDVLVRFMMAPILSQLTDWAGEVNNVAGYAAGDTSMALDGLQASGTIEEGEQFTLENHRTIYTVTANATIAANAATISFFPGLEAAVVNNDDITFRKSTLPPNLEDPFADLVAARLAVNKAPKFFNTVTVGGGEVWRNFQSWGERKLAETLLKLRQNSIPKTKRRYPTA